MIQSKGTKRISLPVALFLASGLLVAGLLAACAGPVETLQDLPEQLRGEIRIVDVRVERRRGVGSVEIESELRQALADALSQGPEKGEAVNLVTVIEDYVGPEGQIGGTRTSGLAGSKSRLRGRVYLVDRKTGAPLAEFRPSAQYQPGAPGSPTGIAGLRRALIDRFVAAVVEAIP